MLSPSPELSCHPDLWREYEYPRPNLFFTRVRFCSPAVPLPAGLDAGPRSALRQGRGESQSGAARRKRRHADHGVEHQHLGHSGFATLVAGGDERPKPFDHRGRLLPRRLRHRRVPYLEPGLSRRWVEHYGGFCRAAQELTGRRHFDSLPGRAARRRRQPSDFYQKRGSPAGFSARAGDRPASRSGRLVGHFRIRAGLRQCGRQYCRKLRARHDFTGGHPICRRHRQWPSGGP